MNPYDTDKSVAETGDRVQFAYDKADNRLSMTDESGTTQYRYDKDNRALSIAKNGSAQISYSYDAVGNIKTVKDKKGNTVAYSYDPSNRMSAAVSGGRTTSYTYDISGNRTSVVYANGVKETYPFDRDNRLLTLKNAKPDGSLLSSYTYAYDKAGRQSSKTDSYGTTNYTYDDDGRILKVEAPGKTTLYAYDKSGNRQTEYETYSSAQPSGYTDPSNGKEVVYLVKKSEYVYSGANVIQQLVEAMLGDDGKELLKKTTDYLYDANGNELRKQISYLRPHTRDMKQATGANPNGDGLTNELYALFEKTSNTFDGFNRLIKAERIQGGERSSVEYTYDGDGLRTQKVSRSSKKDSVTVTNYLYDRQSVILETDALDNVSVRYVRGINYITRADAYSKFSYFLFNGHGDVVHTVSESGVVENQYDYDIFGNPVLTVEEYTSSIRYSGEFYDVEVGLYYLRARYYDPYIGRFISEDTYKGQERDPLSLNLYTYVMNEPIMHWDPTGHWQESDNKMNVESQAKMIALTSAYYNASSPQERNAIKDQAQKLRDNPENYKSVVTPLVFQTNEITNIVSYAVETRGYMTSSDWSKATQIVGITTKTDSNVDVSRGSTSTVTTTTIGRTNLSVTSQNIVKTTEVTDSKTNEKTKVVTSNATSDLKFSYNVTPNEAKFVASMADEDLSLEQVLVLLDTLERNEGNISKEQLKTAGLKYYSGLFGTKYLDNISTIESAYSISNRGMTVSEAEMLYNQEVVQANIESAFGISAMGMAGKGLKLGSTRMTKPGKSSAQAKVPQNKGKVDVAPCNCFTAGTKVQTDEGEKNIEDIEVGDMVLSKDEETGEQTYKEVTATFNHETDEIYKIHVGDQVIESTFNHPFYVEGKGWTFVKDLKVGDLLVQSDGNTLEITSIELLHKHVTVYNMTVDEFHTYFVSDLGIWVHNTQLCYKTGDKTPGGHSFSKHGAERANERGFTAETIDNIINNNKKNRKSKIDENGDKTWEYTDARGNKVVTNESGGIVSVHSPAEGGVYIPKPKK